ncbi:TetR/AcrR family transcriptional regulator [Nonomuraea endophytica]|uniref:AcrR family transcriptional regulator n=1 Tax=Nonomuraea endophytica TaxID=714136 RepID=A0A7W8EH51_9ACTN|nr:TetR/AcrR family transcriptional regulator [Nonomuraea endophytica]MBB5079106.1 AcrR family transcriptional regulator [Nonomuraea endophytica]
MASLRERKKRQTRQALMDAAAQLFDKQGYETTTVDQIAAAAGVSTRTFFTYFRHKADVLYANSADCLEAGVTALGTRRPGEPPTDLLARAFDAMLAESWEMGLIAGLVGDAVKLPIYSAQSAIDRSNNRMARLATALAAACELDRVTAYAMVGAALGAVSASAAAAMSEGGSDDETMIETARACRRALVGFAD